jgi:hypothetical protein
MAILQQKAESKKIRDCFSSENEKKGTVEQYSRSGTICNLLAGLYANY